MIIEADARIMASYEIQDFINIVRNNESQKVLIMSLENVIY